MPASRTKGASRSWLTGSVLIALALVALATPLSPTLVESRYSSGAYVRLQQALTPASNIVPFALLDVTATMAILLWLARLTRAMRASRRWPAFGRVTFDFVAFTAALYLVFLALWGLNYRRVPLDRKLDFDPSRITREAALAGANRSRPDGHHDAGDRRLRGNPRDPRYARARKDSDHRTHGEGEHDRPRPVHRSGL